MVHRNNHQSLLNRGRKAGLTTRELNSSLAGQPADNDEQFGRPDCNGSVWTINDHGQRVCVVAETTVPVASAS